MQQAFISIAAGLAAFLLSICGATSQTKPFFFGTVCYSKEDLQEVMDKGANMASDEDFKKFWFAKKSSGRCYYNLDAKAFRTENANEGEKIYKINGRRFMIIFISGRVGDQNVLAFSALQVSLDH